MTLLVLTFIELTFYVLTHTFVYLVVSQFFNKYTEMKKKNHIKAQSWYSWSMKLLRYSHQSHQCGFIE